MTRSFFLILFFVFSALIVSFTIFLYLPNELKKPEIVIIEKGKSTIEIARLLKEKNIIKSQAVFIAYAKSATSKKLIQGEYEFKPGRSLVDIFNQISSGDSVIHKITIPEGYSVKQIIDLLNTCENLDGVIEKIPEEGTLFPSTYFYKYKDKKSGLIKSMQDKMNEVLEPLIPMVLSNSLINTKDKVLTLASIIEKEGASDYEKKLIASVFLNRIKIDMPLQADPTVIYAVTSGEYNLGRPISKADLAYDSPYNTYKYKGLPPGAISCPGMESIKATIMPANTNYLYFVVNGPGTHAFSSSLEEHNSNVVNYRKMTIK